MPQQLTVREAVSHYFDYQRSVGNAASTIENIRSTFKPFVRDYGDRKVHQITSIHISDFMADRSRTRVASSLGTTHNHMSGFFGWAVQAGQIKPHMNPMNGRKRPKALKRERLRVPLHRFPEILHLAEQNSPRDRFLVAMALSTLMRDQEMASRQIRDVDLGSGYIMADITKSHMEDRVPITADLDPELRRWLTHYQSMVGPLRPEYRLIPRVVKYRRRDPLTGRLVPGHVEGYDPFKPIKKSSYIVTPLLAQMGYRTVDENGVSLREGAHTLRRSGARVLYDKLTADGRADAIRVVQNMLHHEKMETTQEYIGLELDRATRDELLRGVSIFGFDQLASIGLTPSPSSAIPGVQHNGETQDHVHSA